MIHGYIRLWPSGPSQIEQQKALLAVGADPMRLHVDDERGIRRQVQGTSLVERTPREIAIHCMREGDLLAVASPMVLGSSRDDVLRALAQIEGRGGALLDAETNREIKGLVEASAYADLAQRQLALKRTEAARKAVRDRGIRTGPSKKPLARPYEELLAMWMDPVFSAEEVAASAGVSRVKIFETFEGIRRPTRRRVTLGADQRKRVQWVYVLTSDTAHKVGCAVDPEVRLRALRHTFEGSNLVLHREWHRPNDAVRVEKLVHRILAPKLSDFRYCNINEWFDATPAEIEEVVEAVIKVVDAKDERALLRMLADKKAVRE